MTVASIGGPRHFDAMVGHMMTKYSIEHRGVWSRGVKRGVAPMKREHYATTVIRRVAVFEGKFDGKLLRTPTSLVLPVYVNSQDPSFITV